MNRLRTSRMPLFNLMAWFVILLVFLPQDRGVLAQGGAARTLDFETTRTEMIESRNRRAKELELMLKDARSQLKHHDSGHKLLDKDEKGKLERQVQMFQRKLEHLLKEPDDQEVERVLHRERARDERVHARRARESKEEL